jgi:cysteine desulfurase
MSRGFLKSMLTRAYFDNHLASKPSAKVLDCYEQFLKRQWGSISSYHQMGYELYQPIDSSLQTLFKLMHADPKCQFSLFGSNLEAISSILDSHYREIVYETGRNHFITTSVEDAAILKGINLMERLGCHGKMLSVNAQGVISLEELTALMRPRTSFLSLACAHGLTGVIQPYQAISQLCTEHQISLHLDVSTIIGKIPFSLEKTTCDYLSFDGSKFHALPGTVGLLHKASLPSCSNNIAGVVALKEAMAVAVYNQDHLTMETARLRTLLEEGIEGSVAFFRETERLPNIAVIAFPGIHAELLLFLLSRKGVYASIGGGTSQKLSHILKACGVDPALSECAISFNLSVDTTEEEVVFALQAIKESIDQLKFVKIGH